MRILELSEYMFFTKFKLAQKYSRNLFYFLCSTTNLVFSPPKSHFVKMAAPSKKRATEEEMKLLEEKHDEENMDELEEESDMEDGSEDSDMVEEVKF